MKRILALAWMVLLFFICSTSFAAVTVSETVHCDSWLGTKSTCIRKVRWAWSCSGSTTASDSTATAVVTGRIVGIRARDPNNDISVSYTVKILDSAGHDVLQGVGVTTEFSATPTDDSEFRVPVDSTNGGYIYLCKDKIYLDISSSADGDSGVIELYVELP